MLSCDHRGIQGVVSISEAIRAARNSPETGTQVQIRSVVTYLELQSGDCVIEDASGGLRVVLRKDQLPFEIGKLVEARGLVRTNGSPGLLVEPIISVMGEAALPPAVNVSLADDGLLDLVNRRISFKGTVESDVEDRPAIRLITVRSGGFRAVVRARLGGSSEIDRLPDAEVRVTGILVRSRGFANLPQEFRVWSSEANSVQVLKPPVHPGDLAVRSVQQVLMVSKGAIPDHRVRVRGALKLGSGGLRIQDETGVLGVHMNPDVSTTADPHADLYGFLKSENGDVVLDAAAPVMPPKNQIREVTSAFDLHRLPLRVAALLVPVHFRPVVTFSDPAMGVLFVQDGTDAAYVQLKSPNEVKLNSGDIVDLKGFTTPGDFAPNVGDATARVIGTAPLPHPETDLEAIFAGQTDCRWVEMKGIVQDAVRDKNGAIASLQWGSLSFKARIAAPYEYARWLVDRRVIIHGAIGSFFNRRRQILGVQVFVPGAEFIQVVEEGPTEIASLAPQRIDGLLRFSPNAKSGHRVRVQGIVTLANPSGPTWISDPSGGMKIESHETADIHSGDLVDVLGFPQVGGFGVTMKGASVTKLRSGLRFVPIEVTPEDAIDGSFESQLVRLEGTVVNGFLERAESVIVLRSGPYLFDVRLPLDKSSISELSGRMKTGAEVRVTGICSLILDRSRDAIVPRGFEILLPASSDIEILTDAPWLTMDRLGRSLLGMLIIVLAAFAWIAMLRRNVSRQTRKLEQANAVANEALQRARQAESLEQNLKVILEMVAKDEPLGTIMAVMTRAAIQHVPGAVCSIQLDGPDGSRTSIPGDVPEPIANSLACTPIDSIRASDKSEPVCDLSDRADWLAVSEQATEHVYRTYRAFPILQDARRVGYILTFWSGDRVPSPDEIEILESWGRFAGLSVERRGHYQELSHRAHHDNLTGLHNRGSLYEHLERELSENERQPHLTGLLYIDLDGFKPINDRFGHATGDVVLQEVSRRILANVRHTDRAARVGGDEFAIVLPGLRDRSEAERIGALLVEVISRPLHVNGHELLVGASVGISVFPEDADCSEELLKAADQAMYGMKSFNKSLRNMSGRESAETLVVA